MKDDISEDVDEGGDCEMTAVVEMQYRTCTRNSRFISSQDEGGGDGYVLETHAKIGVVVVVAIVMVIIFSSLILFLLYWIADSSEGGRFIRRHIGQIPAGYFSAASAK
jgi:hypothetical protein